VKDRIDLSVVVEYGRGANPSRELLAAAVAEHVRKSGEFTFSVDKPGGAFESSRWTVRDVQVLA
jgi:hypothetical protein